VQFAAGVEQVVVLGVIAGFRFGGSDGFLGLLGEHLRFGFWVGVYEVQLVPGRGGGGQDGVPDYGFGGGFGGTRRGVDGFEVEEDLLGVPAEEGGEVYAVVSWGVRARVQVRDVPASKSNLTCAYSSFL
jgi:hypothetical protein